MPRRRETEWSTSGVRDGTGWASTAGRVISEEAAAGVGLSGFNRVAIVSGSPDRLAGAVVGPRVEYGARDGSGARVGVEELLGVERSQVTDAVYSRSG